MHIALVFDYKESSQRAAALEKMTLVDLFKNHDIDVLEALSKCTNYDYIFVIKEVSKLDSSALMECLDLNEPFVEVHVGDNVFIVIRSLEAYLKNKNKLPQVTFPLIRIKLYGFWSSSYLLNKNWCQKMCPGGYNRWQNMIVVNDRADYHIIMSHPHSSDLNSIKRENAIYIQTEPSDIWRTFPSEWRNITYDLPRNNIEWLTNQTYDQLLELKAEKTKTLSTVISGLSWLPGHRKRLDFCKVLNGVDIDVYGRGHSQPPTKKFLGEINNKEQALTPYRYHIAIENSREQGYITEKLAEPILNECLVFYYGAPDADKYINKGVFIPIDIEQPDKALEIIKAAIDNDEWSKRIQAIRSEKLKILNELAFFPMIYNFIKIRKYEEETKVYKITEPVYVLTISETRKKRMAQRLTHHGLIDQTTFVQGITVNDKEMVDILDGTTHRKHSVLACFRSHLKTLKTFLADTKYAKEEGCIVLEEDAMLHKNFVKAVASMSKDIGYVLLSPYSNNAQSLVAKEYQYKGSLYWLHPSVVSMTGYWISRKMAEICVRRFDMPQSRYSPKYREIEVDTLFNSENGGLMYWPPLVVEDCHESFLEQSTVLIVKRNHWSQYNYDNYSIPEDKTNVRIISKADMYEQARSLRFQGKFWEALELLNKLMLDPPDNDEVKYFGLWDEYSVVGFYTKRELGIMGLKKIIENASQNCVMACMINQGPRVVGTSKFYGDNSITEQLISIYNKACGIKVKISSIKDTEACVKAT